MRHGFGAILFLAFGSAAVAAWALAQPLVAGGLFALGLFLFSSIQVVAEWERAIILRFGRFHAVKGAGVIFVFPVVDTVAYMIDTRVITTPFTAEQTLTSDGVPVDVDAVLFWKVIEPKRAAMEVEEYRTAITWAAQTALREIIGRFPHETVLSSRDKLDMELQQIIDRRTEPWGIRASSVEIRDIVIPEGLQKAMSSQAQAQRELQARVILGNSEVQIAQKFEDAAKVYAENPTALHLRAMNMLYEAIKEKGSMVVVPSTAVETMGLGAITGLASLSRQMSGQASKPPPAPAP